MEQQREHVSVCICTYKRPRMLLHLLRNLENQRTERLLAYSVVIVDNDIARSARDVVDSWRKKSGMDVSYHCEPRQNIALARNRAVQNAQGALIALIDDDEFPDDDWLVTMYKALRRSGADGVLGPVKPRFEEKPPDWVVKGKFYEKGGHRTGDVLRWQDTRTSNVLIKRDVFADGESMFRPELGRGGEDKDFFKRAIDRNRVFVWCSEAHVYETIPAERCTRAFMLKRALLRGKVAWNYPNFDSIHIAKSVVAIPAYTLVLPFAFLAGHHHFMDILIRQFEHAGRILALFGLDVVKQYYVMK